MKMECEMRIRRRAKSHLAVECLLVIVAFVNGPSVLADEVRVMSAGNTTPALLKLAPQFERSTGHKIVTVATEMGVGTNTLPNRIRRGEPVDLLFSNASQIEDLTKEGYIVAGSRIDLARSRIGMAVRAGTPKPSIRTLDDIKRALLRARSVALSAQVSGVYVSTELLQRLGIADQVLPKVRRVEGELVADVLARGEADLGIQQISELLTASGVDYVGPLPKEAQLVTLMSAGIPVSGKNREAARALLQFLASPGAAAAIRATGLEPVSTR
jgi:molybdate transport system substrate-binding protein